jgi:hypothetical protein
MTATSALASFGVSTKPAQEAMLNCCSPSTFRSIVSLAQGRSAQHEARIERCSFCIDHTTAS